MLLWLTCFAGFRNAILVTAILFSLSQCPSFRPPGLFQGYLAYNIARKALAVAAPGM